MVFEKTTFQKNVNTSVASKRKLFLDFLITSSLDKKLRFIEFTASKNTAPRAKYTLIIPDPL